jgi:PAS domain S-box-containing protein
MQSPALVGRDEKIDSSQHSISLTDLRRTDAPIIYVNKGFENLTGYTNAEAIGRNCRFLQGPETDTVTVSKIRTAIASGDPLLVDLLNYRKDGSKFWNRLSLRPVRDASGSLTHYIGIQSDLTRLKELEERLNLLALDLQRLTQS